MKKLCAVWMVLVTVSGLAQSVIEPYPINITTNKTTNIIFPAPILSVDRGNGSILVQKAKNVENILLVKADSPRFQTTNLSVVILGGKLYSFLVNYADSPDTLNISFQKQGAGKRKNFLHVSTNTGELKLRLQNIYIYDLLLSFSFQVKNFSEMDFEPSSIKFFIRDAKRSKRTAAQEIILNTISKINCPRIKGNQQETFTASFKPFSVPKHKRLICEISDENAERVLTLIIKHKTILKARTE